MSEQFALHQAGSDGGTVDLYERAIAPIAEVVNRTSHQFLAGAGFSADEHGRGCGCHELDPVGEFTKEGTRPHHFFKRMIGTDFFPQVGVVLFQTRTQVVEFGDVALEFVQIEDLCFRFLQFGDVATGCPCADEMPLR